MWVCNGCNTAGMPELGGGCCCMHHCNLERLLVSSLPREMVGREGLKLQRRGAWCLDACLVLEADQLHPSEICCPSAALGDTACMSGACISLSPLSPLPVPQFPSCSLTMPVVAWQELGTQAWVLRQ